MFYSGIKCLKSFYRYCQCIRDNIQAMNGKSVKEMNDPTDISKYCTIYSTAVTKKKTLNNCVQMNMGWRFIRSTSFALRSLNRPTLEEQQSYCNY